MKTKITFSIVLDKSLEDVKKELHAFMAKDCFPGDAEDAWAPDNWMYYAMTETDDLQPENWKVEEIDDSKCIPDEYRDEVMQCAASAMDSLFGDGQEKDYIWGGTTIKGLHQMTDIGILEQCGMDSFAGYVKEYGICVGHDPETNEPIMSNNLPDEEG